MKAALLETLNAPLVLADVEPLAPDYGQVAVRVLVSGFCGAQLQEIAGLKGNAAHLPHLLGHEGCGIVEAVGPGVTHCGAGDKVVMHWRKGDGIESNFPKYRLERGGHRSYSTTITSGKVITLAERAVVSENRVTVVPDDVPPELCALLGCGLSTALGTIEQEAGVQFGESVLVIGCGGVGMNLILAARLAQAFPVYGVDIHEGKRAAVLAMGAHEFAVMGGAGAAAPPQSEANRQVRPTSGDEITGPFDVVIDTTGNEQAMEWGLRLLSGNGRFIMIGQPRPGVTVGIPDARRMFNGEGQWIKATQGGGFQPGADIPRYVQLWRSGALNLDLVISHRFPLAQLNEAIDCVRAGQAGRVMIEMEPALESAGNPQAGKPALRNADIPVGGFAGLSSPVAAGAVVCTGHTL